MSYEVDSTNKTNKTVSGASLGCNIHFGLDEIRNMKLPNLNEMGKQLYAVIEHFISGVTLIN